MKIVLASGGVDSALLMARNRDAIALHVDYGQHAVRRERVHVLRLGARLGLPVRVAEQRGARCPDPAAGDACVIQGRNLLLITLATLMGASEILIGCCGADQADYPDCRPEWLAAADAATAAYGARVRAPLLGASKRAVVAAWQAECGLPTWSCYRSGLEPCGECGSCVSLNASTEEE